MKTIHACFIIVVILLSSGVAQGLTYPHRFTIVPESNRLKADVTLRYADEKIVVLEVTLSRSQATLKDESDVDAVFNVRIEDRLIGSCPLDGGADPHSLQYVFSLSRDAIPKSDLAISTSPFEEYLLDLAAFIKLAEQGGADQPTTAPESKPEGDRKLKPESEVRSQ